MEVTKQQIAHGIARYIQEDMIPQISDSGMQILMGVAAGAIDSKPQILDKVLDNEMLSAVAKIGDRYDLELIRKAAIPAVEKYGKLTVTIPGIKFISPEEKVLQFGSDDIRRLIDRIERG